MRRSPAGAALALVLVAACGGGESPEPPATDGPTAGESRTPDSTATERFRALLDDAAERATTARVTLESSGGATQVSGTGDVDATSDPVSAVMTLFVDALGGGGVELRIVDDAAYLRVPRLSDGQFLAFDVDDPDNPLGGGLADQLDPRAQLEALASGVLAVERVGSETGPADNLQRYRVTVDSEAVGRTLGPDADDADLPDELTYTVWFDGQRHLRRLLVEPGGAVGAVDLRYDEWGTAVDVAAPLPGQVLGRLPEAASD